MNNIIEQYNNDLIEFWNKAYEYDNEIDDNNLPSLKELAPSLKLYDAICSLNKKEFVLDYGCGSGWASLILASQGVKRIKAVDIIENGIKLTKDYIHKYNYEKIIDASLVKPNWLKEVKDNTFNAIFTSNVLDVIPLETSMDIIKEMHRILKKDGELIIGMNFYLSKEMATSRNLELVDDKYLFVNNVLRLTSLSDEEWIKLFSPYFDLIKLDYFAWKKKKKETRRLFYLRKKHE